MKKKCKVVMLPTEKESLLYRIHSRANNETVLGYGADVKKDLSLKPQHLYLISNDKIKGGDWGYIEDKDAQKVYGNIIKVKSITSETKKIVIEGLPSSNDWLTQPCAKKVIASTDPKLINRQKEWGMAVMYSTSKEGTEHWFTTYDMPTFSEDFIKAYVKANGEIDEVNVEYDSQYIGKHTTDGIAWLPKLRDGNTVIISQAKTMYSRDEVVGLLMKASKDRAIQHREGFNKWIEENL